MTIDQTASRIAESLARVAGHRAGDTIVFGPDGEGGELYTDGSRPPVGPGNLVMTVPWRPPPAELVVRWLTVADIPDESDRARAAEAGGLDGMPLRRVLDPVAPLQAATQDYRDAQRETDGERRRLAEAVEVARGQGVPVTRIAQVTGLSRMTIYEMLSELPGRLG